MVRHKGSISSVLSFQAWLLSMDFGPVRTDDGGSWRGDKYSTCVLLGRMSREFNCTSARLRNCTP
jgi:hypothetical protein